MRNDGQEGAANMASSDIYIYIYMRIYISRLAGESLPMSILHRVKLSCNSAHTVKNQYNRSFEIYIYIYMFFIIHIYIDMFFLFPKQA